MTRRVEVTIDRHEDHLVVSWTNRTGAGSCRFDRLPDATPEWLGAAHELLEGAARRDEGAILDAVADRAAAAGLQLGIWHDDEGVELL